MSKINDGSFCVIADEENNFDSLYQLEEGGWQKVSTGGGIDYSRICYSSETPDASQYKYWFKTDVTPEEAPILYATSYANFDSFSYGHCKSKYGTRTQPSKKKPIFEMDGERYYCSNSNSGNIVYDIIVHDTEAQKDFYIKPKDFVPDTSTNRFVPYVCYKDCLYLYDTKDSTLYVYNLNDSKLQSSKSYSMLHPMPVGLYPHIYLYPISDEEMLLTYGFSSNYYYVMLNLKEGVANEFGTFSGTISNVNSRRDIVRLKNGDIILLLACGSDSSLSKSDVSIIPVVCYKDGENWKVRQDDALMNNDYYINSNGYYAKILVSFGGLNLFEQYGTSYALGGPVFTLDTDTDHKIVIKDFECPEGITYVLQHFALWFMGGDNESFSVWTYGDSSYDLDGTYRRIYDEDIEGTYLVYTFDYSEDPEISFGKSEKPSSENNMVLPYKSGWEGGNYKFHFSDDLFYPISASWYDRRSTEGDDASGYEAIAYHKKEAINLYTSDGEKWYPTLESDLIDR